MKTRASILRAPHAKCETVELDVDDPQPTEVLVKMVATGLCHSDGHIATGDIPVPVFPFCGGHEGAGIRPVITSFSRSCRPAVAAGSVPADTRTCVTTGQTFWSGRANQITQRITPRSGVFNQARAILAWHGVERIRRLNTPTTVVHGAPDPLIPVENGRRLAKLIPHATYAQLAGVGHLVAHEAGDALPEALGE
jgi:hypothetical protein